MRVSFDGELYRGSHVTGPTHNHLALSLKAGGGDDFDIVAHVLEASADAKISVEPQIRSDELRTWVLMGIDQANAELGTTYGPDRAEFVVSDSYRPEIYVELARRIVLQAHADRAS